MLPACILLITLPLFLGGGSVASNSFRDAEIPPETPLDGRSDWDGGGRRFFWGGLAKNGGGDNWDDFQFSANINKAAKAGTRSAQVALAVCYRSGIGVRQDEAKARRWFVTAATQGDPTSMLEIGEMLCSGEGFSQDKEKGIEWIRKAASKFGIEEPANCDFELGEIFGYEELLDYLGKSSMETMGYGKPTDYEETLLYLGRMGFNNFLMSHIFKAAKASTISSQNVLAVCYSSGFGNWFMEAAKQGNPGAIWKTGDILCRGEGAKKKMGVARKRKVAIAMGYEEPVSCDLKYEDIKISLEPAGDEGPVGYSSFTGFEEPESFQVSQITKAAEAGHMYAQVALAICYRKGFDVPQDEKKARHWLMKAAIQEDPHSMLEIGEMLCKGEGFSQDKEKGLEWMRKATMSLSFYREPTNCDFEIGELVGYGNLVKFLNHPSMETTGFEKTVDYEETLMYIYRVGFKDFIMSRVMQAAKAGTIAAQNAMALCYRIGIGVRLDDVKSWRWLMLAAQQGNPGSMWLVGVFFCKGEGVSQDKEKGVAWKRKAAIAMGYEEPVSCDLKYEDITDYLEIAGYEEPADYSSFVGFEEPGGFQVSQITEAAKAGDAYAQFELAVCYRGGIGVPQDEKKARRWLMKAARQGNPHSMWEIGEMLCNGDGFSQDKEKGLEWIKKAATAMGYFSINEEPVSCDFLPLKWNASAQASLAVGYREGIGVRQDEVKARFWLMEAAKQGNPNSMWDVGEMLCTGDDVRQDKEKGLEWIRKAANVLGYEEPISCDLEFEEFEHDFETADYEEPISCDLGYEETEHDLETADCEEPISCDLEYAFETADYEEPMSCDFEYTFETVDYKEPVGYKEPVSKKITLQDLESVASENFRWRYILVVFFLMFLGSVFYLIIGKKNNDESTRRADDALDDVLNETPPTESSAARNRKKSKKSKREAAAAAATESETQPNSREVQFEESGKPKKLGSCRDSCKKVNPLHRSKECAFCLSLIPGSAYRCKGCSKVYYCNHSCQTAHWNEGHKAVCLQVRADYAQDLDNAATPFDRFGAPEEFLCPISKDIMNDPVVAADNKTYDRASIEQWMAQATAVLSEASACLDRGCGNEAVRRKYETQLMIGVKSPITSVALCHLDLEPNLDIFGRICEYRSHFDIN